MSHGVMFIVVVKILSHQMPCKVTGWVLHVTRCHVHGESPIYRMPSRVMGIWINVTWCHVHWYLSKSRHTECRLRSQGGCCMSHGVMCMIKSYIPNAIKGHRIYGRMWHVSMRLRKFPILRMPCPVTGSMDCSATPIQSKLLLWDLNHGVPPRDHTVYQFLPFMR